jgi:cysteine synthase A
VNPDDGKPSESHPSFRPHLMQGWTPDFIPALTEDAVSGSLIDQIIAVDGNEALRLSHELAQKEGIFAGITGGATLAGALQVCESAEPGATVLCMLPDTGERYLSTPLFEQIPEDMNEQEMEISKSTPNYRFDVAAPAPAAEEDTEAPVVKADAETFVADAVSDPKTPVVMFAMEWCEFCWSVRKMLAAYGIPYRSIDLDSVAYQENNRGGEIRVALAARTSFNTFPQIFVGGEVIGGCTELFDAYRSGELRTRLGAVGIEVNAAVDDDPYEFLPKWLHSR